jgi:Tol biopolymer transport system component
MKSGDKGAVMIGSESKATMRMQSTARIAASVLAIFIVVAAAGQGEMAFRHQSDIQKDSRAGLRSAAGEIERIVNASGVEPARRRFKELRGKEAAVFYLDEREMNALGYRLMQNRKMPEAIAVFEMNTFAFPQSWNAWDSLAEAHLRGGESDKAEAYYEKSIGLNPDSVSGKDNLSQLRGHKLDAQGETKETPKLTAGEKTGLQGPYLGQNPPGLEPRIFAPGVVSTVGNFEFAITFTPDGRELYFTRRSDGGGQNTIMVSRWEQDGWSAPEEAAFCKDFPSNEPYITPDGKRLYFGCRRQRPGTDQADYGIWVTERTAGGGWGEARYYGLGMYVSASRSGDLYMTDIFNSAGGGIVRYLSSGGTLSLPEKLGGGVNAPRNGDHAFIAPDGSLIVFDSYFRPGGQGGEGDLWVCFKKPDGTWTEALNLGDTINTPATNFCPSLSPDGKYVFYSTCRDIYWVSAEVIERLRPKEAVPAPVPFDPRKTYPAEALREDLRVLWDMLEEGHGGFDRYTPASVLKTSFGETMNGLTGPMTELDYYVKLLPLIAAVKDGHTRALVSPPAASFLDDQPVAMPVGLRFLGGKAYIFRNLSPDASITEGSELLAVNGMPMGGILSELTRLIPNDAGIQTRKLRQMEYPATFGRLFALRFGRSESYRLRLRLHQSKEVREITVPGIKGKDVVRVLYERYPDAAKRLPLYELTFRGTTGVLTVRSFGDDPEKGSLPYPEFLNSAFRTLEEKKTKNLIIDLRGNGGGMDEYGKLLFAHVMDRPFLYYWALEAKKDRYDLFRYTNESAKDAEELAKPLRKNARGWFDVLGHPNRGLQMPQEPGFSGRVAILIDGGSFSATGETTSAFHYYKKAVFFGEECGSGYYGNTSGFMVTATLPNTRIQIRIPLILYTMAVDGYPKDRGIVPDVPVSPTIEDFLEGRDPVMERALRFLERK